MFLHPELIKQTPLVGSVVKAMMQRRIQEAMDDPKRPLQNNKISVVLRTLNEHDTLRLMLEDINQQEAVSDVEIIVVDNESNDGTPEVAKKYGAKVLTLARKDFTYPKSMNMGVEAASNNLVFLSVGHAMLSNRFLLAGAARHFEDSATGGVFSRALLGSSPSQIEKLSKVAATSHFGAAKKVKKATMGVLGATNCMISKEVWLALGKFDEDYEMGGEDWALAKLMLARGLNIIEDPIIVVHHSHGLGALNYMRQIRRWSQTSRPTKFDRNELTKSRPDKNFS
jgi:glycosyltransferase involved in cell wall biosynthesis